MEMESFMDSFLFGEVESYRRLRACALALVFFLPNSSFAAATRSKKMPVVPKWERFEHEFKSTVSYLNPLQDATLTVEFTSPLGEKTRVYGFWDGGRTW